MIVFGFCVCTIDVWNSIKLPITTYNTWSNRTRKKSLPRNIAMEIPVIYLILTKLLFIDYIMYYTVKRPLFQLYELVQFFSRISFSLLCFTNNTFTAHKSNIYQLKFTFRFYVSIWNFCAEFDKQIQLKQNVVWDFGIEMKLDWISVVKMDQSIEMQNFRFIFWKNANFIL